MRKKRLAGQSSKIVPEASGNVKEKEAEKMLKE
jgi:hypothetical protein